MYRITLKTFGFVCWLQFVLHGCTLISSNQSLKSKKKKKKPEVCLQPSRMSSVFLAHNIFVSLTITSLSVYLNHRAILTLSRRMWTASNSLFERLWILVLRSPTAHRNNVNTLAEQFVFYLQVHLRLCTGQLHHSLLISVLIDLLWVASKLTLSPSFGGGVICTPLLINFPCCWWIFEAHVTVMSPASLFLGSVLESIFHFQPRFSQAQNVNLRTHSKLLI